MKVMSEGGSSRIEDEEEHPVSFLFAPATGSGRARTGRYYHGRAINSDMEHVKTSMWPIASDSHSVIFLEIPLIYITQRRNDIGSFRTKGFASFTYRTDWLRGWASVYIYKHIILYVYVNIYIYCIEKGGKRTSSTAVQGTNSRSQQVSGNALNLTLNKSRDRTQSPPLHNITQLLALFNSTRKHG